MLTIRKPANEDLKMFLPGFDLSLPAVSGKSWDSNKKLIKAPKRRLELLRPFDRWFSRPVPYH